MDPNAGGKVQPLNAGRIEPGPRGLPNPGNVVRKGEVLAYVVPSAGMPIERSNQSAQLAELRAAKSLADKRVARLKELADTVPRKDIEAAESEAPAWPSASPPWRRPGHARSAGGAGVGRDRLGPRGGRPGGRCPRTAVRDRRPGRLRIEALAFDPHRPMWAAPRWRSATSGCRWPSSARPAACASRRCRWVPRRGRPWPIWPSGQPVRVFVQTKQKVKGIAVPVAALMKNPANQTIVWVKTAPERFEPRTVTTEPLDGT
jgi:cobalt-zinc-cadmium efflux system membrane fusion protein